MFNSKQNSTPAFGALLSSLVIVVLAAPLLAERLHESSAHILRIEANTIYVWSDADVIPSTDFTLELKCGGEIISARPVTGVLDHVVTSQKLTDEIIAKIQHCSQSDVSLYLDSERISDSLIIAMPGSLRDLWLDTLWIESATLPVRYQFHFFNNLNEIFIASSLEQVDLLIMPEIELSEARILAGVPIEIEWNLLCSGIKDDLVASALNYCLRGVIADSSDTAYSSVILPEHLQTLFPRNPDYARELFHQSRYSRPLPKCGLHGFKMYPALTERLNMELSSCNGGRLEFEGNSGQSMVLALIAIKTDGDPDVAFAQVLSELPSPVMDRLRESSSSRLLDSCLIDPSTSADCRATVSRAVAEFSRIIPLGRSKLAVQQFDHVRFLDDRSGSTTLDDFYTIKK